MVWFRVDDGFARSRKVLSIPKAQRAAAIGLWTLAGTWAAGELTDGFVPNYALDEIFGGKKLAPVLVSAGLWDETEFGFQFHDWSEYQPSKADVMKDRAEHAARQKAYRDRKQAERDGKRDASRDASVTPAVTVAVTGARPDPTRPDPTVVPTELPTRANSPTVSTAPRGTRLPADWQPTAELIAFVKAECPNVDGRTETENFRDHWHTKPGREALKLEWPTVYRKWMRTAQTERVNRATRRPTGAGQTGTKTPAEQTVETTRNLVARLQAQENQQHAQIGNQ